MALDKDIENLNDILEYIERIEQYTSDFSTPEEFYKKQVCFDATLMNFVNIGEAVSRISPKLKNQHTDIDWESIKGLRNMIAHDYLGIDAEEIWQITRSSIPLLEKQIKKILI